MTAPAAGPGRKVLPSRAVGSAMGSGRAGWGVHVAYSSVNPNCLLCRYINIILYLGSASSRKIATSADWSFEARHWNGAQSWPQGPAGFESHPVKHSGSHQEISLVRGPALVDNTRGTCWDLVWRQSAEKPKTLCGSLGSVPEFGI